MSSLEWRWGSPSSEAERTYQTWMSVSSKVLWGSIALRGGCSKRELYNACFYRTVTMGSGGWGNWEGSETCVVVIQ